jgi:malonyl-CoA O-methyltransferase
LKNLLTIDKRQARRAFELAAAQYDEVAFLQREIADRMLERLQYIRLQPVRILDVGAGTGYCTRHLLDTYPHASVMALDIAQPMLQMAQRHLSFMHRLRGRARFVVADIERLPLCDQSVDMIISNLTLQWSNDLPAVFAEFERVLAPQGVLFFTTFGPATLQELRESWAQVNGHTHVNNFVDLHDIGDMLLQARLADPIMDAERLTVTYSELLPMLRELKQLGAHNVTALRPRGLTGRQQWEQLRLAYEQFRQDGVLPVTYEVIYGHAWKGN